MALLPDRDTIHNGHLKQTSSIVNRDLSTRLHQEYTFYSFGKWLYYPDRVAHIKERAFREVMPVTAQLSPALGCNFCCPRCSYGKSKIDIIAHPEHNPNVMMDYKTMITLIDKLSEGGLKGIVFTGGGEPTLNPFLVKGMRHAVNRGLKIGLFTNGSLLTEEKINAILQLEPTFFRISLDAGSPIIHRLLHGYSEEANYLTKVLRNLEILSKQKVRLRSITTVGVGVSVEPVNLNDLTAIAERLREIAERPPIGGIDYVVFRPTVNYDRGRLYHSAQPVLSYLKQNLPEYYEDYHNYLYRGYQLPSRLFVRASEIIDKEVSQVLSKTSIKVINLHTKMFGINVINRPYQKCRASPWYIFVGPDGMVYNCVELAFDPRVAIGNLLTLSLVDIWRSRRRQEVMDLIDCEGLQNFCPPVCLYYELNSLFEDLDSAFRTGRRHRSSVLRWISSQEARVCTEMKSGRFSQHHREFI